MDLLLCDMLGETTKAESKDIVERWREKDATSTMDEKRKKGAVAAIRESTPSTDKTGVSKLNSNSC